MHEPEAMPDRLAAFLGRHDGGRSAAVLGYEAMTGGYSRLMARADVRWSDGTAESLVLRGDPPPGTGLMETDRGLEWALLSALCGSEAPPLPAARFYDPTGDDERWQRRGRELLDRRLANEEAIKGEWVSWAWLTGSRSTGPGSWSSRRATRSRPSRSSPCSMRSTSTGPGRAPRGRGDPDRRGHRGPRRRRLLRHAGHPLHRGRPARDLRATVGGGAAGWRSLLDAGRGLVFLHHAIAGWPAWPEYAEIVGGRFHYQPGSLGGRDWPDSGYRFHVDHTVEVLEPGHPVCAGLPARFPITDELYLFRC